MKHLFIVNPTAGGHDRSDYVRETVEKAFSGTGKSYEVYVTKAPLDAVDKISSEAAKEDSLRVYSCGGDGTFNECVTAAVGRGNVSVCPMPVGTGNDFCRMFGEESGLFSDINALLRGKEHPIDVIDCGGRYSVNLCSVGVDARIGCNVHKYSGLPIVGGAAAYVISAIVEVFKGITSGMHIECAGKVFDGKMTLAVACNGRFYGGGFNPSTTAMPDDGELDFFIVRAVSLPVLAVLIGQYAKGKADKFAKYITHLRGTKMSIRFDREQVINLDGEAVYADHVDMKLLPKAVKLIVPEGMKFFEA